MSAGANCANMLSENTREMTLEELIEFLTPNEKEGRAGAVIMSTKDFEKQKTTIELLCIKLGNQCSPQVKEQIQKLSKTIKTIQEVKMQITAIPVFGPDKFSENTLVLQKALNKAGYKITEDGYFGNQTKSAVSTFQKKKGLAGSGILGPKTIDLLGIKIVTKTSDGKSTITQDFTGKQDRRILPEMRVMLEEKVFPNGKIPQCFTKKDPAACYVLVMQAMADLKIFEKGGNNKGFEVGLVQGVTGTYKKNGNGDAWCLDYCQVGIALVEDFFRVESPVFGSAHCMTTWNKSKNIEGLVAPKCETGTLALGKRGNTSNGHAMAVIKVLTGGKMQTSEGNTSISNMTDGDGSGIKTRDCVKNGDLVTQGFLRLYPFNLV